MGPRPLRRRRRRLRRGAGGRREEPPARAAHHAAARAARGADRPRAEHARRGRGARHPPRPARSRGGARRPGARDGRHAVAGARRASSRRCPTRACRATTSRCPRTWPGRRSRCSRGATPHARGDARVPVALPRGAARARRRDHAAARDRGAPTVGERWSRRLGRLAIHPVWGWPVLGARALRALRVRRRVRRGHARQPDGEGPLPRVPQPVGGVALLPRAVGLRARPRSSASTASSRWASRTASRSCCRSS